MKPVHRKEGLVVHEHESETLVYDLIEHRAISLNEIVTLVWNCCDGSRDIQAITETVSLRTGERVPFESVLLSLDELRKENLLETAQEGPYLRGMTRREALRKIGLASTAALPLVLAITAPTAANAQSTCIAGGSCTCSQNSRGRKGLQCTPSVVCANPDCRCIWENNGANPNGTCEV
ncbi:MAG TPA: PqqD family protein [Aridibacter sp.]|nr:PqqD family protein [Aridibacter sp.]